MLKLTFFSSLVFLLAFAQNPNSTIDAQINGFASAIDEVYHPVEDSEIEGEKWYFATSTCYCASRENPYKVTTVGVQEPGDPEKLREIFKHNVLTLQCFEGCAKDITMHGPYDDHLQADNAQRAYCEKMREKGYKVSHETMAYKY